MSARYKAQIASDEQKREARQIAELALIVDRLSTVEIKSLIAQADQHLNDLQGQIEERQRAVARLRSEEQRLREQQGVLIRKKAKMMGWLDARGAKTKRS